MRPGLLRGRVVQRQGQPLMVRDQRLGHRQGELADNVLGLLASDANDRGAPLLLSVFAMWPGPKWQLSDSPCQNRAEQGLHKPWGGSTI